VNFNSKLKEAASFGQPITEYDPASRGHQDFEKLANWLVANPPQHVPAEEGDAAPPPIAAARNRAAELVERARSLQARTAALAAKLGRERAMAPDVPPAIPAPAMSAPPVADAEPSIDPPRPAPILGRDASGNGNGHGEHKDNGHAVEPSESGVPMTPSQALAAVAEAAQRAGQTARSILRREPDPPASQGDSSSEAAPADRPRSGNLREKIARMFGVRPTGQGLLFVQPINGADRVSIAADFNGWSPNATPMKRDDSLGVWQACVPVEPGRYRYRLVIDGEWTSDPFNKYVESNPFGELNNVVEVDA
jgi:hypothetical protein